MYLYCITYFFDTSPTRFTYVSPDVDIIIRIEPDRIPRSGAPPNNRYLSATDTVLGSRPGLPGCVRQLDLLVRGGGAGPKTFVTVCAGAVYVPMIRVCVHAYLHSSSQYDYLNRSSEVCCCGQDSLTGAPTKINPSDRHGSRLASGRIYYDER